MMVQMATHRIPPYCSREAPCPASWIAPLRDIVEDSRAQAIQKRIQEPEWSISLRELPVVEQRDEARERRARSARARHGLDGTADVDLEVGGLHGDVGERAAGLVEQVEVDVAERPQVGVHCPVLVERAREDVGEPARGEGRGNFRQELDCASHGGDAARLVARCAVSGSSRRQVDIDTHNGHVDGNVGWKT